MEVRSQFGSGTTFTIHLPSVVQEPDLNSTPPRAFSGGTETILVVDDEPALLALVSEILEHEGYSVLRAGSAEEAVRSHEENLGNLDLLLADVVLPGMSGVELAEHLAGLNSNLAVLHMSGYPDEVILHHGIFQGAISLIEKPFTRTQLALRVREALDSAKVPR